MSAPNLRFVVLSDVHIPPFPNSGRRVFAHALEVIARTVPQPDLLILNGDIIYQLDSWQDDVCRNTYEKPYDMVLELLDQHLPGVPRMFVLGNHEFPQNNDDPALTQAALDIWKRKIQQPICEHRVVKGLHFIKYPLLTWSMPPMPDYEAWAMTELQTALDADPDAPVFFVSHDSTADETFLWPDKESFTPEFRAFLTRHPRIVHLAGHRHIHLADDQRIYQDGFTTLALPCCAVGQVMLQVTRYHQPRLKCSQSMMVEVCGPTVTVRGIDHAMESFAGDPLTIDTAALAQGVAPYSKAARQHMPVPEFAPEAAVSVAQEGEALTVSVTQAFASAAPFPFYYEFTVADAAGAQVQYARYHTDFDNVFRGQPAAPVLPFPLSALPAGDYTLSVRPLNSLRMGGAPRTVMFSVQ